MRLGWGGGGVGNESVIKLSPFIGNLYFVVKGTVLQECASDSHVGPWFRPVNYEMPRGFGFSCAPRCSGNFLRFISKKKNREEVNGERYQRACETSWVD
jgi:hypothetical protein